ncbi:L-threonine 3-dehydrogenase [subsurface metagenome]
MNDRLRLAKDLGADFTLNPEHDDIEHEISEITSGKGPAVVFEATGDPDAVITSFKVARACGRVVLIASTRGETNNVNFYEDVHKKGLVIIGAHNTARPLHESSPHFWTMRDDCELVLRLISQKRLLIAPLISHRLSWENAPDAYEMLMKWDTKLLGVILDWSSV